MATSLLCWKVVAILASIVVLGTGFYLCFGSLPLLKSPFVYRKFLTLGIVMISFGAIVLIISATTQNLCYDETSAVYGCGSIMSFSGSLVPAAIAIIAHTLTTKEDLEKELKIPVTNTQTRTLHNSFLSMYRNGTSTGEGEKRSILAHSALIQMITVVVCMANALSLNLLAFLKEYNLMNKTR